MNDAAILETLTDIFRDVFDNDSVVITTESSASDFAEWDSLSNINLMVATEMHFGIRFKTSEVEGLKNVGELIALIRKHLDAKAK